MSLCLLANKPFNFVMFVDKSPFSLLVFICFLQEWALWPFSLFHFFSSFQGVFLKSKHYIQFTQMLINQIWKENIHTFNRVDLPCFERRNFCLFLVLVFSYSINFSILNHIHSLYFIFIIFGFPSFKPRHGCY